MMRRLFYACCFALLSAGSALAAPPGGMDLPPQPKVRPAGIPANYMLVSPCIAGMGDHWADVKGAGLGGVIYGTDRGKPIFSEIMATRAQLDKGYNFYDLKPLPGYKIDHVNVEWHPKGHPGMPVPHYDVHAYYISHAAQMALCPNGVPDPDMEKMPAR